MQPTTLDTLASKLQALASRRSQNILISAGRQEDKLKLLQSIHHLTSGASSQTSVSEVFLYATHGTYVFLTKHGIACQEVGKISEQQMPNILNLLHENHFDLIINILTGDRDYDEASDAKLIRKLSIEHAVPLITDADVAIAMLNRLGMAMAPKHTKQTAATARHTLAGDQVEAWDMKTHFMAKVTRQGGFANHHAHFDKAYLISPDNLQLSQVDMQAKWALYKSLKENYTFEDLCARISRGIETMIAQGVSYCRSMVDADATVGLLPVQAAMHVKQIYADRIVFDVGVQPLQGVIDAASYAQYEEACRLADYCGALPSKDRPHEAQHLDIVLQLAKRLGKCVDVHIDQENNPLECETEMLADKVIEHGMQGQVFGIHAISVSAKTEAEQDRIIEKVIAADLGIVICPSAALSMKQLPMQAPLHNSIGPFVKMQEAGVRLYLGIDNVHDLFMPIVDGDIWTECRMLMEACRFYDIDTVAHWACSTTQAQQKQIAALIDAKQQNRTHNAPRQLRLA